MVSCIILIAGALVHGAPPVDDPWADAVIQYSAGTGAQYRDPSKALGAPVGGGPSTPDNSSIVSLGAQGGFIVLKFDTPVTDDPLNPMGLDCMVYSNAFWTGGNPQVKFQEPGLIEISEDVNGNGIADDPWYLIPGSRHFAYNPFPWITEPAGINNSETDPHLLAGNIRNPNLFDADPANDNLEYNWGYCEMTPTMTPYLDNYVRPDDLLHVGVTQRSGGGDAFDIAWAVDADGSPAHLTQFHFIRITSFIARNLGAAGVASPDIDAVADVVPDVDTDGDGILDEYEVRVADTDPNRRESTLLPLETPPIWGGSPPGTILGTAEDSRGTKLRLYADQQRTEDGRAYNVKVDILAPAEPGLPLPSPGLLKSGCVREIQSSEPDFVDAGIQPAEITMHYEPGDIAGLDELALQPYLDAGAAYTQSGISAVQVNAAVNLVTFRTRYPGLFLLASTPGSGDTGSTQGPQGDIVLTANPPAETVADSVSTVTITSTEIRDDENAVVSDGTLITVATTAGTVMTPDADAVTPGIQVATLAGAIAFTIRAPSQSGSAWFTATSVEGAAYGELAYTFVAGPPAPPVAWTVGKPDGEGPVDVVLTSTLVRDAFGNRVRDGILLTLDIHDAIMISGDADLGQPGFQVVVANGHATVTVETPATDSVFTLATYADSAQTQLLGQGHYSPADYAPMPLHVAVVLALALLLVGTKLRR